MEIFIDFWLYLPIVNLADSHVFAKVEAKKLHVLILAKLFNRDLSHDCLVYKFSLLFSGSKFLKNLRRQFRVRKIFSCT